ncbi:hypothetical protein HY968_04940 [Candidatus Kaiserbacteria bacterium]|nr:hypothetical protein [Candidatus Kaiserbacteria bacterium]
MKTLQKVALFWDVDREKLDPNQSADFIIKRILAYGDVDDVKFALTTYGAARMYDVLSRTRDLDKKSRNFWNQYFAHA